MYNCELLVDKSNMAGGGGELRSVAFGHNFGHIYVKLISAKLMVRLAKDKHLKT